MKILMICEYYNEELDYQEALLAKYYRKVGCEVTVVTTPTRSVHDYISGHDDAGGVTHEQGLFAKIIRVPVRINFAGRIRVFQSLRGIVEDERPDLIYFHDIIPNMVELRGYLKSHLSCCAIMDYHADYSNSGSSRVSRWVLHRLSRRVILSTVKRRLSAILPVVPASQRFLRDLYGIDPARTELFPLGVDADLAATMRTVQNRASVRKALGIPEDALVIFTGGKLNPAKRTEDVLEAAALLNDPRVHVVVVGEARETGYQDRLLAAAAGINAHFVGWQDREGVYRHQAAADLAVFPASQSVLWQQSIGMGLPLVVGEGSGPERTRQDVGYLNRAGNLHVLNGRSPLAPQIADFLQRCLVEPDLLRRMAAGAEEVTQSYLSYERLARRTIEIMETHRARTRAEAENA